MKMFLHTFQIILRKKILKKKMFVEIFFDKILFLAKKN